MIPQKVYVNIFNIIIESITQGFKIAKVFESYR